MMSPTGASTSKYMYFAVLCMTGFVCNAVFLLKISWPTGALKQIGSTTLYSSSSCNATCTHHSWILVQDLHENLPYEVDAALLLTNIISIYLSILSQSPNTLCLRSCMTCNKHRKKLPKQSSLFSQHPSCSVKSLQAENMVL